jgi:hypothetical protein
VVALERALEISQPRPDPREHAGELVAALPLGSQRATQLFGQPKGCISGAPK